MMAPDDEAPQAVAVGHTIGDTPFEALIDVIVRYYIDPIEDESLVRAENWRALALPAKKCTRIIANRARIEMSELVRRIRSIVLSPGDRRESLRLMLNDLLDRAAIQPTDNGMAQFVAAYTPDFPPFVLPRTDAKIQDAKAHFQLLGEVHRNLAHFRNAIEGLFRDIVDASQVHNPRAMDVKCVDDLRASTAHDPQFIAYTDALHAYVERSRQRLFAFSPNGLVPVGERGRLRIFRDASARSDTRALLFELDNDDRWIPFVAEWSSKRPLRTKIINPLYGNFDGFRSYVLQKGEGSNWTVEERAGVSLGVDRLFSQVGSVSAITDPARRHDRSISMSPPFGVLAESALHRTICALVKLFPAFGACDAEQATIFFPAESKEALQEYALAFMRVADANVAPASEGLYRTMIEGVFGERLSEFYPAEPDDAPAAAAARKRRKKKKKGAGSAAAADVSPCEVATNAAHVECVVDDTAAEAAKEQLAAATPPEPPSADAEDDFATAAASASADAEEPPAAAAAAALTEEQRIEQMAQAAIDALPQCGRVSRRALTRALNELYRLYVRGEHSAADSLSQKVRGSHLSVTDGNNTVPFRMAPKHGKTDTTVSVGEARATVNDAARFFVQSSQHPVRPPPPSTTPSKAKGRGQTRSPDAK